MWAGAAGVSSTGGPPRRQEIPVYTLTSPHTRLHLFLDLSTCAYSKGSGTSNFNPLSLLSSLLISVS